MMNNLILDMLNQIPHRVTSLTVIYLSLSGEITA